MSLLVYIVTLYIIDNIIYKGILSGLKLMLMMRTGLVSLQYSDTGVGLGDGDGISCRRV